MLLSVWSEVQMADDTAIPPSLLEQNPEWFIHLVLAYTGSRRQRDVKRLQIGTVPKVSKQLQSSPSSEYSLTVSS